MSSRHLNRRSFLRVAGLALAATQVGPIISAHAQSQTAPAPKTTTTTQGNLMTVMTTSQQATADDTSVRPFSVDIPQDELLDLRRRITATRFADRETVDDQSQGVQLATTQALA